MIAGYRVAQLRDAERRELARTPPGFLMRQAAAAVAKTVLQLLPQPRPGRRVLLAVGTGNNGGDALLAGVTLRKRGIGVDAVLADPDRTHVLALAQYRAAGGRIAAQSVLAQQVCRYDAVVDGLVGIGARPPLRPAAANIARCLNSFRCPVIAVDVPSGIDPDTGATNGPAVAATVTVTFGAPSTGLLLATQTGRLVIAELGLAPGGSPDCLALPEHAQIQHAPPGPADDKFSTGVVGIAAGSARYPGAAVLAVGAAVRARPGLVRYAGSQSERVLARWPETVAVQHFDDAGRVQAWVVGPGIGTDGAATELTRSVLAAAVPVLVDADALTIVATCPDLVRRRTAPTVLTPHAGEFARLWPAIDLHDRLTAVRTAAADSGAVVLLKGHRTVMAAPDGQTAVNLTGTGQLATAGSGDVLAGLIGSWLAAGGDPLPATMFGAHQHGLAGQRAADAGRAGASALLDYLGQSADHLGVIR